MYPKYYYTQDIIDKVNLLLPFCYRWWLQLKVFDDSMKFMTGCEKSSVLGKSWWSKTRQQFHSAQDGIPGCRPSRLGLTVSQHFKTQRVIKCCYCC